ncbi:hypothetical protein D3C81_1615190 [compost metagenome]
MVGVGRGFAFVVEQRIVGEDPVMPKKWLEADFVQHRSLIAERVDGQPLQGIEIGRGVGLAHQRGTYAMGPQVVTDGQFFQRQGHGVPGDLMAADIAPGVGRHPRRAADGALGVGTTETHAGGGQAIDVGGVQVRMAVARQVIAAQLIAHDVQHVAHGVWGVWHGVHRSKDRRGFSLLGRG